MAMFFYLMFVLAADGGTAARSIAPDAGVVVDAGVVTDAGVARDAGVPVLPLALDVEEVVFHAKTPVAGIDGTTKKMTAARTGDRVRFVVPLDGIDTGIGLRNTHMKKYLGADQFPNAELEVSATILKPGVGQKAKGTFTVKGVSKEVELAYDVKKVPGGFAVQGSFAIDLKNHGITVPTYAGVTVKKDVTVETSFVVAE